MNEEAILDRLEGYHRQIEAGLDVIRDHCRLQFPNSAELAAARSELSSASLARSAFVTETVVPCLIKNADADFRSVLSELQCVFEAKRQVSCNHVMVWTAVTIGDDWAGYRAAARAIWAMMEDQIALERNVLIERLKAEAIAVS